MEISMLEIKKNSVRITASNGPKRLYIDSSSLSKRKQRGISASQVGNLSFNVVLI
jgi:sRNA-binding carbon storage regulator CsrA